LHFLALHPICQHFHSGSVLTTTNSDQNIIKFFTNELGVQKVKDIWISADLCQVREDDHLFETQSLNNSNISTGGLNKKLEFMNQGDGINNNILTNDEGILQDLDHYATSFFLKVLEKFDKFDNFFIFINF